MPFHFHSLPLASRRGRVRRKGARLVRRSTYGERDYAFGQLILTLRSAIGLTQAGLSDHLGISKRAVGEWEAGSSYPKATHLQALIALAVKEQVFPIGHEEEEIRALWKAAHQKVLLDETWLSVLLSEPPAPSAQVAVHQNGDGQARGKQSRGLQWPTPGLGGRAGCTELLWAPGGAGHALRVGGAGPLPCGERAGPGRHRQVRAGGAGHARAGLPLRRGALSLPARRPTS